jgi:tetratricopeptide (TPR) repeat protein
MRNRLLTFGVLCIAGTVNTALFGGATPLVVALASNIFAGDLVMFWGGVANRLRGRDAVLQSEGLSQAVGRAIAAVVARTSRLEQYRDYREPLKQLASRAASGWTELAQLPEFADEAGLDSIREANLAKLFSVKPTEFAQAKALTPQDWERVLNAWQQKEPEAMRDPQVMREIAEMLHHDFPKALREVMKEDFATGGRSYAGLMLDLAGDLRGALQDQHEGMLARLDRLDGAGFDRDSLEQEFQRVVERLEALSMGNTAEFKAISEQIESGFENIAQLLTELGIQLATAKQEILENQKQGFQRLEEKLDGLERPMLTVSVVIDPSRPKMNYWQGRQTELTTLRQQLEQFSLVGITGLGGYGKSALANQLFETSDWPTKIWVTMSQPYRFSELGRWLLGKLGYQLDEKANDDALAKVLTDCLAEHRCLVVFDNLETLLESDRQWRLPGYEAFLLRWLEYGRNSAILVTSREQPRLPTRNSYWHPSLMGLKVADGAALLRDYGVVGNEVAIQEFVELAGGHPLLLELAAALLVDEFGENPDVSGLKIPGLNLFELVGLHRGDPEASVNKLFAASFERLEERLQRLLCCVSVYRLPFNAAAAAVMLKETALTWQEATTQKQIEQDLLGLAKRSLLQEAERNAAPERRFQFLPLIARYVQRQENDWTWAHERAIFFHRSTAKQTSWETDEDLREYFETFHHHCELNQFALADDVLDLCNHFLRLRGYNRTLVELYRRLVQTWQPSNKQDRSDFSWALISLGNAYDSLGQYPRAIEYYEQSLAMSQAIGDRNGEANSLIGLGNAYDSLGQYPRAIEYYEQSLTMSQEIGDRNGEAASLTGLGNAYNFLGQYPRAIEYYEQSLTIKRKIGDRNGESNSLIGLGSVYNSLGQYPRAIKYHKRSLAIKREIGDRNGEARSLNNLGNAYNSLGQYPRAIKYHKRSLAIKQGIGDRNGEARSLNNLGNAYNSLGQYPRAIEYYEQSLAMSRKIGDQKGTANAWFNLGNTLAKVDRIPDASVAYRNARQLFADMGLEADVQNCDAALQRLLSASEPLHRHNPSIWVRLWNWLKQMWHKIFSQSRSRN